MKWFAQKNKKTRPPKGLSQGVGNGLCGIYVWLNAMDYFSNGALKRSHNLLEEAFEELTKYGAQKLGLNFAAAGEGLDYEPMVEFVVPANQFALKKLGFEIQSQPFKPAHDKEDFSKLCEQMQNALNDCNALLLLGLENFDHFTLAHSLTRTHIRLIDSYGITSIKKAESGGMKSKHQFNINPDEITLITCKPKS